MERSDSVDWFLRARRFALGASVALLTAVLTVGCGSSSSSSTDTNGGGTTPPPSGEIDTQDVAVEVASLAFDFEDYADLLLEAEFGADDPSSIVPLSVDARGSSNPLVNITRGILKLTRDAGEISIQATEEEFCDVGSVAITETASGYEIVFNQCQSDLFGTTYTSHGKVTYEGREDGGTLTYDKFRSTLSKDGDILTIEANGTIDLVVTNAIVGAGKVTLNLSYNVSVACGDAEASGSFSYNNLVIEVANDGGITIGGGLSFSFSDADGSASVSVTIATVEPIRFEDEFSEYPSSGKVNVTLNGETIAIEYVAGGVLVDGEFVSWEAIEADFDEDDFDDVFDQCSFDFDFDDDFDFDFDN